MSGNHATPPPTPGPLCAAYAPLVPLLESALLTDDETTSARAHLATCAWCREEIGAYAVVDDALRRHYGSAQTGYFLNLEDIMRDADHLADDAPTPPPLPTVTAPPPPSASSRGLSRMSPRMLAAMAGMAAVLLIALFAGVFAALQAGRGTANTITQPTASITSAAPTTSIATAAPSATSAPTATATAVPTAPPKPTPVSLANVNVYLDVYLQVTALNGGDGSARWQVSLPSGVALGTASVNGIVMYMTDAAPGVKIGVHGLRASDGTEIWYNDLGGQRANAWTVNGGTLYAESGATWHAIDPTTGTTLWSYTIPSFRAGPVFADGIMYALTYDGTINTLSAIRISDGTLIKELPGLGWPIAAGNGLLYTITYPGGPAGTNDLTATRISDWSQAWQEQAPIDFVATLRDGIIYGGAGANGERIAAVDALTGQVRWTSDPGSTSGVGADVNTIVVQDNTIYVRHQDGTILALDPATGARRWKIVLYDFASPNAPLLLAGGYIFTTGALNGANHEFVVALNAQDGSEVWRYQANTFLQTLDVGTR